MTNAQASSPRSTLSAQPTEADTQLLQFAQGVEITAHDLYKKAADSGKFAGDELAMINMFGEHHKMYAQAINGLIGKSATNQRNESLYSAYVGQLGSAQSAYISLHNVENTLAATNTDILGQLRGIDAVRILASIITVEARQAAVFGTLPGLNLLIALDKSANSLAPSIPQAQEATTETTVAP